MLVLSFAVFLLSAGLRPEAAAQARAGGVEANLEAVVEAEKALHLEEPLFKRYGLWLADAVHLNFGESFAIITNVNTSEGPQIRGVSVVSSIGRVLPRTASVVGIASLFAVLLGLAVGILGGVRPGSLSDRITFMFSTIGLAVPNFWIAMILISVFAISLGWLPAVGYVTISDAGLGEWFSHLLMPALALSLAPAAVIARQMRASLAEVMGSTYIRTAWAKGASLRRVVVHHALKNAAAAPLTVFGVMLTSLLGGTVIIETLFGIDGLGNLIVNAVRSSDIPMIQGVAMLFIVITVAVNLLIDILYASLDPKLRLT
jgi:peptide/nickel transport system permease protein